MKTIFILVIIFSLSCSRGQTEKINYSTKTNSELILMLATIDKFGAGYSPNGHYDSFFLLDQNEKLSGVNPFETKHNQILKEIVSRGVKIVPSLIKNINNNTKSNLSYKIVQTGMGRIEFSDEYEPKDNTKIKDWPEGNSKEASGIFTFSIGDFCFFALGQIVNRNYHPMRYQMTCFVEINSPIESKELKNNIINDWANLSISEHQNTLINDFRFFKDYRKNETLKRIKYYYPELVLKYKLEPNENAARDASRP